MAPRGGEITWGEYKSMQRGRALLLWLDVLPIKTALGGRLQCSHNESAESVHLDTEQGTPKTYTNAPIIGAPW